MNVALIFQPVIAALWYLIPLLLVAGVIKTPWFKGWMGEAMVNLSARLFLDKTVYHLIRNVTLPTEDGTTQIDHIIVSPFGVFVVETKNMKGWIFGNASERQWTQKIYRYSQKFQNLLHQNYKHVKTLQSLLGTTGSGCRVRLIKELIYLGREIKCLYTPTTLLQTADRQRSKFCGLWGDG